MVLKEYMHINKLLLFMSKGTTMMNCLFSRQVFETFGPVQTPFYSVRFNVDRDINDKDVHVGDKVFYAPDMMEFSNFVFVTQLKK